MVERISTTAELLATYGDTAALWRGVQRDIAHDPGDAEYHARLATDEAEYRDRLAAAGHPMRLVDAWTWLAHPPTYSRAPVLVRDWRACAADLAAALDDLPAGELRTELAALVTRIRTQVTAWQADSAQLTDRPDHHDLAAALTSRAADVSKLLQHVVPG